MKEWKVGISELCKSSERDITVHISLAFLVGQHSGATSLTKSVASMVSTVGGVSACPSASAPINKVAVQVLNFLG